MAVMLHLQDETTAGLTTQDAAAPCPELQGTEPGPAFLLPQAAGGADPAPLCSLASFPGGTPRAPACPQSSAGDPAESSSLQRLPGLGPPVTGPAAPPPGLRQVRSGHLPIPHGSQAGWGPLLGALSFRQHPAQFLPAVTLARPRPLRVSPAVDAHVASLPAGHACGPRS